MKILRELQPGEEVYLKLLPGRRLHLQKIGKGFEYRVPVKHRLNRRSPEIDNFFAVILTNEDFVLYVRPIKTQTKKPLHPARIPYNALTKVLVFTGQTNEDTVKTGRKQVVGSTFSSRRRIAWDNRRAVDIPLEHPHHKPAERLFEEVRIA